MLRCLKDKIEAGVYEVSCEVIDRLGGTALKYDAEKQLWDLEKFRKQICEYDKLKKKFLLEEQVNVSTENSSAEVRRKNLYEDESDSDTDLEADDA